MRVLIACVTCLFVFSLPAVADTITSEVVGDVEGTTASDSKATSALLTPISASFSIPVAFPGTVTATANQQIGVLGAKGAVAVTGMTNGGLEGALFSSGGFGPAPDGHFMTATNKLLSTANVAANHKFSILLTGATLKLFDFGGAGPGIPGAPTARFDILATLSKGGVVSTIFESTAILNGGLSGHTLTETGQDLDATFVGVSPFEFGYEFDPFATQLDLGMLDVGDFVEYSMSVHISAAGFELGALAIFGDPNDLDGNGSTMSLVAAGGTPGPGPTDPVPEPASLLLVAAAIGGLAFRRYQSRSRS